ncbi:hypothetical protein A1O3_00767 [Capronia epimyces CBS 606.96]|uniref:FAD dependent oxidoreductase domain-containing protein n=1 Tax=Capronia epimyces CBS 606.96 TaxID=1182542 RepID=W9YH37_9EURO|nr:uncharacterized protein A1O3_00767 [Capronia epimyces CBS 606.96]EXJ92217.1 hypothetical protein A1O3_00767 [Capronia epimyces CBS 606.96]
MALPQVQRPSYLIIGAGAFGAPTALALKRAEPESEVTVVDRTPFPCPMAAGHDLNKIIRADYIDLMYMKLALKALELWRTDPLYSPHFHNIGYLYSYDEDFLKEIIARWEQLLGKGNAQSFLLDPVEARKKFNGVFEDSDWSMVTQCLYSPTAGWADSAAALQSVMQAAVDLGVRYVDNGAAKVLFGEHGNCTGAVTEDGRTLTADRTILAAGAWIPLLLAESAPDVPEIHTGERLIAVGAPMCAVKLSDEQLEKFKECPVNALLAPLAAECIPPGDKGLLKCTYDTGFSNKVYHEKSRQEMSLPPSKISQSTWSQDIPQTLKDNLKSVKNELFGGWVDDIEPESYRLCWDGFTLNQDWLICPHPKADNLYVAGGGSFHGFKFLPVIGELVVQMIKGELDEEMTKRWAWDGPREGAICPAYTPHKDLGDLS